VCVVYRYAYVCIHENPEPPARESERERVSERAAARDTWRARWRDIVREIENAP